jgi:hypothetical protein
MLDPIDVRAPDGLVRLLVLRAGFPRSAGMFR